MVSNFTDSENQTYAMPSGIADVLASSGFAEAALAFKHFDGEEVPAAMRAQLSLASEQRLVTQDDIARVIDEAILRAGSSTHPAVNQLRQELQGKLGKPLSALTAMESRIEALTSIAQNATSDANDPEKRAARIERLWAQIDEAEENIEEKMRRKLASGEITQQQFNSWYEKYQNANELQAAANRLPEGAERDAAQAAAAEATVEAAETAGQHLDPNDEDVAKVRDEGTELLRAASSQHIANDRVSSAQANDAAQRPAAQLSDMDLGIEAAPAAASPSDRSVLAVAHVDDGQSGQLARPAAVAPVPQTTGAGVVI